MTTPSGHPSPRAQPAPCAQPAPRAPSAPRAQLAPPAPSAPVAPRPRRGRPGYDLESLLAVAVRLFNERGYDGTSMEDLSRKLGITKSAIYHHVPSKEELLRLAVNRALDGLFAEVDRLDAVDGRAIDRLEHLVRGSVVVLAGQLPFVTLLLRVRGNTKVEREALARRREFDHLVADLVAKAAAEGDLRSAIDPAVAARLLFGMVNSLVEWYRPRGAAAAEDLADTVVTVAFDGLRVRPS
jgi:AcrR family transcriptional regulator